MRAVAGFLLTLIFACPLLASRLPHFRRAFDAPDAVIPGATVTVRHPPPGFAQAVPTDKEGHYRVAAILGGGALMVLQSGLIGLLLVQRSRRRRTEAQHSAILRAVPDLMFLQTADGVFVDYHAADPGQLFRPPAVPPGNTCATCCRPRRSARSRPHSPR